MCRRGAPSNGVSIAGRRTLVRSDSGQPPPKRFAPQTEQNVFALPSAGWYVRRSSWPATIRIESFGAQPFAVPTPPEMRLQEVQWQKLRGSNRPVSSNRTPPQRQLPLSAITPSLQVDRLVPDPDDRLLALVAEHAQGRGVEREQPPLAGDQAE